MKLSKKQPINSLKENQQVDDIFVVKIKKGVAPYVKGWSFLLILSDSSGSTIDYKYWGNNDAEAVQKLYDSIKSDSVVHVRGSVSTYNGKLQISTNDQNGIRALKDDEFEACEFIKKSKKDPEAMYNEILEIIGSVENLKLKEVLSSIYKDPTMSKKIKTHPAAIEIHHNWVGGLLQHMIEMVRYCELSLQIHPSLNRDILISGVLLHDVGKLEEIEVSSRIKGTAKGQLLGHISIGFSLVMKKLDEFGLEENMKNKILHVIVSHHGRLEFGSPKTPMIPEAIVIHYADEMSSKITEIIDIIEEGKKQTEDDFVYSRRKNGNIFLR